MAQVVVEMSSDEAKLYRGMQRIIDQQNRMDRGNKTVKNSSRDAGKQQEQAFGARAVANLAAYAGGMLSISAGVGFFVTKLKEANQLSDQLAQKQRQAQPALGKLTQLAATLPPKEAQEYYDRMIAESMKTRREGGSPSLEKAYELQFALESAGMQKYRKDIAKLQGTGVVVNAEEMVTNIAALIKNLGVEEVGTFREAVSKAMGASKGAPTEMPAMTLAAAGAGAQARAMGLTDEELFAAAAVLASTTGTGEEAKVQLEGFLKQVEKEGIAKGKLPAGLSIRGYVEEIDKQLAGGADVRDILGGRQQAITGYRSLSANMADFNTNLENVNRAAKTDAFGRAIGLAESRHIGRAVLNLEKTKGREEVATVDIGTAAQYIQTLQQEERTKLAEAGRGSFFQVLMQTAQTMDRIIMLNERQYLERALAQGQGTLETRELIRDFLDSAKNLKGATDYWSEFSSGLSQSAQRAAAKVVPE